MPDIDITIGGRSFSVSCRAGEEHFLNAAAKMLDSEAEPILQAMGRLPEARMLLMAGLMLADRTASVEDENRALKVRLAEQDADQPQPARVEVPVEVRVEVPVEVRVEVPVVPQSVTDLLSDLAEQAEALAASVEARRA